MLVAVFLVSSAGATPPDWMTRQGSIGWALTQSDNTSISVDCVVIDKIKAKQQPGYFVIRECFNYRDRVVVLTQPNQALRLGMNVDVSGTLITLPNGCRAIVSPTVMGYTDEDGVLLTHGGPCIKGLLEPTPWEWKVDLTVNEGTGTMSSMSTPQTISSNDDEPNATPAEGASYYSAVADILEAQSSTQTTTTNNVRTQSYYNGIPEVRGLPDGSLVELEAKGITAVGTQNIGGTNYNYLDMIENPPATDTIRCYYTGTAAVTDRVNRIAGQIRHTDPQTPVIDIDTGPDYDPQIFEGNCQLAAQGTIAWAKTFPDGTQLPAQLEAKVVSGCFGDLDYGHFFIQEPSRASGIRVNPTDYYWYTDTGYPVTITSAQVTTINDQRALIVSSEDIENDWENWTAVNPLGMNNKWVAGGPFNVYTPGATDAFGMNNIGLLIKTWGLASNVQPSYFYINDGSDNVGVKVDLNMGYYNISHSVQAGDYAAVTGIAQLETVSDQKMRVIKPRDYYDIQVIASAPHFNNITVTPNMAGVGDTVSISFSVDHTLAANPTVTVNGHSAAYDSGGYYSYNYTYTVLADDPSGWATIVITGRSADGLTGSATKSDALQIVDLGYDARGNRRSMRDSRGVTYYEYDVLGRVTKVTEPDGKWVAYAYDDAGNRSSITAHLGQGQEYVTSYTFDERNHVSSMTDWNNAVTTFAYCDDGLPYRIDYPDNTFCQYTYNSQRYPTLLVHKKKDANQTVIASFQYSYDSATVGNNGTRTQVVESLRKQNGTYAQATVNYFYDSSYQLIEEQRSGDAASDITYAYDPSGNRVSKSVTINGQTVTTSYTYDAGDKMLTAGGTNFGYDDSGNMTSASGGSSASVAHNWNDRPTTVTVGSASSTLGYTGVGLLSSDGTTEVVDDPAASVIQSVLFEVNGDGSIAAKYARCGSMLISVTSGGATKYLHCDLLGSVRVVTDANGDVVGTQSFDSFGNRIALDGTTIPGYGYLGRIGYRSVGNTGLLWLTNRLYDPQSGRFLERDPMRQGRDHYVYCFNNPVRLIDPSGTYIPGVGGCVVGGIVGGIGSWLEGNSGGAIACSAGFGCAIGAISEFVMDAEPWESNCIMGAATGALSSITSALCNNIGKKCPEAPSFPCTMMDALIAGVEGCFSGGAGEDPGLGKWIGGTIGDLIIGALGLPVDHMCGEVAPGGPMK